MGQKEEKVRHLNVNNMHFFYAFFLYISTAFKLPHHPLLSITHHLPSPPPSPPPSMRPPPPPLSPSSTWPPTPSLTQQRDHHYHQPWQVDYHSNSHSSSKGLEMQCVSSPMYVFFFFFFIFFFHFITITTNFYYSWSPSTIHHSPSPHHTKKVTSKMHWKHVHYHNDMSECYNNSSSSSWGAWDVTHLKAPVLFFSFFMYY